MYLGKGKGVCNEALIQNHKPDGSWVFYPPKKKDLNGPQFYEGSSWVYSYFKECHQFKANSSEPLLQSHYFKAITF